MSLDLAYLVIDRAPVTSRRFSALLILALEANDRDLVAMPHSRLAWMCRFTRAQAQEILTTLEADGYFHRFQWGDKKNAQAKYLLLSREKLYKLPRRKAQEIKGGESRRARVFMGEKRKAVESRIGETIAAAAKRAADDLRDFYSLPAGAHLAFLQERHYRRQ